MLQGAERCMFVGGFFQNSQSPSTPPGAGIRACDLRCFSSLVHLERISFTASEQLAPCLQTAQVVCASAYCSPRHAAILVQFVHGISYLSPSF